MNFEIIASTKPYYKAEKEKLDDFCGKVGGVCYMPKTFSELINEDKIKTLKRIESTMGSGHHKSCKIFFRNAESDYGRAVSGNVIALSVLQIPSLAFKKTGIALLFQKLRQRLYCVKAAGAAIDKIKKLAGNCQMIKLFHIRILFF